MPTKRSRRTGTGQQPDRPSAGHRQRGVHRSGSDRAPASWRKGRHATRRADLLIQRSPPFSGLGVSRMARRGARWISPRPRVCRGGLPACVLSVASKCALSSSSTRFGAASGCFFLRFRDMTPSSHRGLSLPPTIREAGCCSTARAAGASCRPLRQRPTRTSRRRRQRRTWGRSTESTSNPSGSIQKPSTGRKPSTPPTTNAPPAPSRSDRDAGTRSRRPATPT